MLRVLVYAIRSIEEAIINESELMTWELKLVEVCNMGHYWYMLTKTKITVV